METFTQIIDAWPSRVVFAADCRVETGLVNQWRRRDSIPSIYWLTIVEAAIVRGIGGITYELLAQLAHRKLKEETEYLHTGS